MIALGQSHGPDLDRGTRDVAVLAQDHDPDLDQKTRSMVMLHSHIQGPDPDLAKRGKITHDLNNHLFPPETGWNHEQKTKGHTDLDQGQEREGKKHSHAKVHRKLQGLVFHPLKTGRTRKKRKI